jgi:hypothetical protein
MITRTSALFALAAIVSISACGRVIGEPIENAGTSTAQGGDATGSFGLGSMGAGGTCGSTGSGRLTCGVITPSGPSACPAQWTPEIDEQLPCNLPSGTICDYRENDGWFACACGCRDEGLFSCDRNNSWGGPCPASPPTPGSASNAPPPSCIAADQPVKDLSDADMQAWCQWYLDTWPPGNKPEPKFVSIENGYVWGGASTARHDPFMCIQHLSVEYCKANLQISQCDATLGQVEDCVRTLWNGTMLVGYGCTPLQQCGCESTIVQFTQLSSIGSCAVPIQ